MAKKKDTPQNTMMRGFMQGYLKENDVKIKDGTDINSIMRDMMPAILEDALDEELGFSLSFSICISVCGSRSPVLLLLVSNSLKPLSLS